MRTLTHVELKNVAGGEVAINVQACAINKDDIYPIVDLLAKFFTALELVLRPNKPIGIVL